MSEDRVTKLLLQLEQLQEEVRSLKQRMTLAEEGRAAINRRADRIDSRLDAIESRARVILE